MHNIDQSQTESIGSKCFCCEETIHQSLLEDSIICVSCIKTSDHPISHYYLKLYYYNFAD